MSSASADVVDKCRWCREVLMSASANVAASAHRIESYSIIFFFETADVLQIVVVIIIQ